jgi:ferritin-like metal-binding protein YciE
MRFISLKLNTLRDLFIQELRDLYNAEEQLVDAVPKMAEAATSAELRHVFQEHARETKEHVARLDRIFNALGEDPSGETCAAMKGLISEGNDYIDAEGDPDCRDAGLISAAQKIEHYEIAGYGTARTLARRLGESDAATLLQDTLDEEGSADKKLTAVAEKAVNVSAARSAI